MVSGLWGAYAAETAEIKSSMKELESHLLRGLHGTQLMKTKFKKMIFTSVINGATPMIVSLIIISPFFLAISGRFSMEYAYHAAFGFTGAILFSMGAFSGKIAKENKIYYGAKMLGAGLVIGVIFYALALGGFI